MITGLVNDPPAEDEATRNRERQYQEYLRQPGQRHLEDSVEMLNIGLILRRSDMYVLAGVISDTVDTDIRGATVYPGFKVLSYLEGSHSELRMHLERMGCFAELVRVLDIPEPRRAKSRFHDFIGDIGNRHMIHVFWLGYVNGSAEELDAQLKTTTDMSEVFYRPRKEVWIELHSSAASARTPHTIARELENWERELLDPRWCEKIALVIRSPQGKVLTVRHRQGNGQPRTLDLPYAVTRPHQSAEEALTLMAGRALGVAVDLVGSPTMSADRVHAYWFDDLPEEIQLTREHRWVDPEVLVNENRWRDLDKILQ